MGEMKKGLKEQLKENEKLFEETGHFYGLTELETKEKDPVGYEIFWGALTGIMRDAFEMARKISSSPVVRESGDCMFGFMTPTGEVVACSLGIIAHAIMPGLNIKWALENDYEEDPGIKPGDIFEANYVPVGAVHSADIYDMVPVFWEGELIGWAYGITHQMEVGAVKPGLGYIAAGDIFGDGLIMIMEKVGENDKLRKDYVNRFTRLTRTPYMWEMDARCRAAGALLIRNRILELVEKHGLEYFNRVTREFIEDSRRYVAARVKTQMLPGRVRKRSVHAYLLKEEQRLDPEQRDDFLILHPTEMNIDKDGKVSVSFSGVTKWLPFSINFSKSGMLGVMGLVYASQLAFEYFNSGTFGDLKLGEVPPGSWLHPYDVHPWAGSTNPWGWIDSQIPLAQECISRLFFSRGFVEEVIVSQVAGGYESIGVSASGLPITVVGGEMVGAGLGGRVIADGDDTSYGAVNPESDLGNAEIFELWTPHIYLGRRITVDMCGKGKYRGGQCTSNVLMMWHGPGSFRFSAGGNWSAIPLNCGLYGAYPVPVSTMSLISRREIERRIAQREELIHWRGDPAKPEMGRFPKSEVTAEITIPQLFGPPLSRFDVCDTWHAGSPGSGDPVEREPALVKEDLDKEVISVGAARDVWCVEAIYDKRRREWIIDDDATSRRRAELLENRKKRGVPFKEWWTREKGKILNKEMAQPIIRMFQEAMELSPTYAQEVREFWRLPEDFTF